MVLKYSIPSASDDFHDNHHECCSSINKKSEGCGDLKVGVTSGSFVEPEPLPFSEYVNAQKNRYNWNRQTQEIANLRNSPVPQFNQGCCLSSSSTKKSSSGVKFCDDPNCPTNLRIGVDSGIFVQPMPIPLVEYLNAHRQQCMTKSKKAPRSGFSNPNKTSLVSSEDLCCSTVPKKVPKSFSSLSKKTCSSDNLCSVTVPKTGSKVSLADRALNTCSCLCTDLCCRTDLRIGVNCGSLVEPSPVPFIEFSNAHRQQRQSSSGSTSSVESKEPLSFCNTCQSDKCPTVVRISSPDVNASRVPTNPMDQPIQGNLETCYDVSLVDEMVQLLSKTESLPTPRKNLLKYSNNKFQTPEVSKYIPDQIQQ